jgi:hypothetical protein
MASPRRVARLIRQLGPIALGLALLPSPALAQSAKEINQQAQFWGSLNSTARLSDHWGVIGDFHLRRNDFLQDPSFYLLRFAGHHWFTEKLTASLGYARLWSAPSCDGCQTWTDENRIYEQVQYAARLGTTGVLHRVRNEQRWKQVAKNDALTGETAFSNRVRYLLAFTVPVSKNPAVPALVLSDEVLLQFGSSIVLNTFDQNRVFTGIKKGLGRSWSFDLGYMLVYQQKASGYQYDLNHTLRCFFYFTPDARGGKPTHEPAGAED